MKKGAFIGFGNVAERGHWPSYAQRLHGTEIVAVVDASSARQDAARKTIPGVKVYGSTEDLFQKETLDFVDICTPPASHAGIVEQALQAGCHVLCEKPLALHTADFEKIERASHKTQRVVYTVHNWKFAPIFQKALALIAEGRIGKVWHGDIFTLRDKACKGVEQSAVSNQDWRKNAAVAGGGILVDHGWHAFYLLLNVIGQVPLSLLAKLEKADSKALEEEAQMLIQFPEAQGLIHLSWRAPFRRNTMTVYGVEGTLFINDDHILLLPQRGKPDEFRFDVALSAGSHHADWFGPVLNDFISEMDDATRRGRNQIEAGWCGALTKAAYESASSDSRRFFR